MRKFLLLILIFCTNTLLEILTLKECVERALEKNISIKQIELNFTEAELNKKMQLEILYPILILAVLTHGMLV